MMRRASAEFLHAAASLNARLGHVRAPSGRLPRPPIRTARLIGHASLDYAQPQHITLQATPAFALASLPAAQSHSCDAPRGAARRGASRRSAMQRSGSTEPSHSHVRALALSKIAVERVVL